MKTKTIILTIFLFLLISFPLNSQYYGRNIEIMRHNNNIDIPAYIIFDESSTHPVYVDYLFYQMEIDFTYHVHGEYFYTAGKSLLMMDYYLNICKYKILKDTVLQMNRMHLGAYQEEIEQTFRNDTLKLCTKDSVFLIDLTKFVIFDKQKKQIK